MNTHSLFPVVKPVPLRPLLLALAVAAAPGAALAQSAGSWLVRLGATQIKAEVTSGVLSAPSVAGS